MKEMNCKIVQDLLPLYVEDITSDETADFIEKHLAACEVCSDVCQKMKAGIQIKTETKTYDKSVVRYVNWVKVWYLLCPMITILLIVFDWSAVLHIYEGGLLLISLCCIASEIYYKGTWWDSECIQLQDEVRRKEKEKRKGFYVRPFLVGLPAALVVFVLRLPEILSYVKMAL